MYSKAKLNFVVDAIICVTFIAATISGLIVLAMPHAGFQGGRNPDFYRTAVFLNRGAWNDIHTWASLALIGGVVAHLVLHRKWILCMVKRYARPRATDRAQPPAPQPCPVMVTDRES